MNAKYLVHLFRRPINVLWNSTDGIGVDLLECTTEKLGATGEDVDSAFHPLLDAISWRASACSRPIRASATSTSPARASGTTAPGVTS